MTENKRFTYWEEENREFPFPYIKDSDGKSIVSLYECVELLNNLHEENEHYKSIFFDIVESALEDKNCRELYCKGILSLFDDANSLNQAREMIKEHLE